MTSFAFKIFILNPDKLNQHPGFGFKALIFAIILLASSFQLILDSDFSILLAYEAFVSSCDLKFALLFFINSNASIISFAPKVEIFSSIPLG